MCRNTSKVHSLTSTLFAIASSVTLIAFVACDKQQNDGLKPQASYLRSSGEFARIDPRSIHILDAPEYRFDTRISDFWIPSTEDVAKSFVVLEKAFHDGEFLQTRTTDKQAIIDNIYSYQFQVVGLIVDGEKHVYINAMKAALGENVTGIGKDIIVVLDGGRSFWQCEVDIESEKVVTFEINGYG